MVAAPHFSAPPRGPVLAAVAGLHVAVAAIILAIPTIRERIVEPAPLYVQLHEVPRERTPEAAPLPQPVLQQPRLIDIPPPIVTLAEAPPAPPPPAEPRAVIAEVKVAAKPAPAVSEPAAAPVESPRYDLAYLRNPPPTYPNISRRLKEQGRVTLNVLVSTGGEAMRVELRNSSGFERLDRAAIDAVRRWKFSPARRGGESLEAWALVPVVFELEA